MKITDAVTFKVLDPFSDSSCIIDIWADLCRDNDNFFLSVGWVSTWLSCLPKTEHVDCFIGYRGEKPVLGFFLGKKNNTRHGIIVSQRLYCNITGNEYYDILTIEYNSIIWSKILDSQELPNIFRGILTFLDSHIRWDELCVHCATEEMHAILDEALRTSSGEMKNIVLRSTPSHYIDLRKIRDVNMDYYSLLSANKRSQIRRSIKEYEKGGEIHLATASSTEEALAMLDGLAELHQLEWVKRGKPGSFSNSFFYDFHRRIIKNRFRFDNIELLKVYTKEEILGYLYSFVYKSKLYFYQCGFKYTDNNKLRPGLVSHYMAIKYYAEKGLDFYDFLAGDSQYKSSLATDKNTLTWFVIQKKRKLFFLERVLKKIVSLSKK